MYYVNMFDFLLPKVKKVTAEDVKKAIDTKENVVILDVRTNAEVDKGKIQGSINIPLDLLKKNVEKYLPDKTKKTYVYCLSGSRSMAAVQLMEQLGYTEVYTMTSGMLAWRAKGYPVR